MKTKYKNLLFIIVALFVAGCSLDDVSVDSGTDFTEGHLVEDGKSAEVVLNGIYIGFRTSEMVKFSMAFMFSGNEQVIGYSDQFGLKQFADNDIKPRETSESDAFYRRLSYIINTSNYLITQVEAGKAKDLPEVRKKELLGEAKTLRAFARFMMLRTYGQFYDINSKYGIIVSNKPIKAEDKYLRKSVKEVYDAIIKDLEFGANNNANMKMEAASEEKITPMNSYVTKTTAKAFLAKVYLYKKNYVKAEKLCKEVIEANTGGYFLEENYADIYSKRWTSSEVLFALHIKGSPKRLSYTDPADVYSGYNKAPSNYFEGLADKQVPSVAGERGESGFTKGYDPRFLFTYKNIDRDKNYKYPFERYDVGNTIYYMRMAEVHLIYAEAAARNNKLPEAVAAINMIRERANTGITEPLKPIELVSSTDKAEVLDLVRKEKMLELFSETGETWFDLVRYITSGDLTFETIAKQKEKEKLKRKSQLTFPMPLNARSGNDKIVQNPGYN